MKTYGKSQPVDSQANARSRPQSEVDQRLNSQSWLQRLERSSALKAVAMLLTTTAAIALVWGSIRALTPKHSLELRQYATGLSRVYPAKSSSGAKLPLHYGAIEVDHVDTLRLEISNIGRTSIGDASSTWMITYNTPDVDALQIIGLKADPQTTITRQTLSSGPNEVAVELGALEPGARVSLTLMLVNRSGAKEPHVSSFVSLPGLPHSAVDWRSRRDHLASRIFPWSLSVSFAFFAIVLLRDFRLDSIRQEFRRSRARSIAKYAAMIVLFSVVSGVILAMVSSWMVDNFG